MPYEENVIGPGEILRVLRATNEEPLVRQTARGLDEQRLQCILTICRKGSEIGEIGPVARHGRSGLMHFRIDVTVHRHHPPGTQSRAQLLDGLAARIAEDESEIAQSGCADIRKRLSACETAECYRRVEIVEDRKRMETEIAAPAPVRSRAMIASRMASYAYMASSFSAL